MARCPFLSLPPATSSPAAGKPSSGISQRSQAHNHAPADQRPRPPPITSTTHSCAPTPSRARWPTAPPPPSRATDGRTRRPAHRSRLRGTVARVRLPHAVQPEPRPCCSALYQHYTVLCTLYCTVSAASSPTRPWERSTPLGIVAATLRFLDPYPI